MVFTKEELVKKIQSIDCEWFELEVSLTQEEEPGLLMPSTGSYASHVLPIYNKDTYEMKIAFKV